MKKVLILCFALCISNLVFAQKVQVKIAPKTIDRVIDYLNDFQGLDYLHFVFNGTDLKGKSPSIFMKEFRNEKVVKVDTLLNGIEDKAYLSLDSTRFEFYFLTQIDNENNKFKTFIRSARFGAGKRNYTLLEDKFGYVMRDFFGRNEVLEYDLSAKIPLLVVIPPVELGNGVGSYCDVVNSGVAASDLGGKFGLKQYFLIEIQFH